MTTNLGRYDSELHMFAEPPRELNMARLEFFRWLAERDRREHTRAGLQPDADGRGATDGGG
jgi:hypothetical protein